DRKDSQILISHIRNVVVFPGSILVEDCFLCYKLCGRIVGCLRRDLCRLTGCIVDLQIPDLTVIVKVVSLDGVCVVDAVSLILIVDRQVCKVGLKSPVRRAVHTCGCKCAESKLVLSCSDIFYDFLKAVEICDVFCCVSCFFQQRLVVDNTIVLNNVGDTSHLVAVHQCEAVVRQLSCDVGTRQVI